MLASRQPEYIDPRRDYRLAVPDPVALAHAVMFRISTDEHGLTTSQRRESMDPHTTGRVLGWMIDDAYPVLRRTGLCRLDDTTSRGIGGMVFREVIGNNKGVPAEPNSPRDLLERHILQGLPHGSLGPHNSLPARYGLTYQEQPQGREIYGFLELKPLPPLDSAGSINSTTAELPYVDTTAPDTHPE
jgi:hypothetical protein